MTGSACLLGAASYGVRRAAHARRVGDVLSAASRPIIGRDRGSSLIGLGIAVSKHFQPCRPVGARLAHFFQVSPHLIHYAVRTRYRGCNGPGCNGASGDQIFDPPLRFHRNPVRPQDVASRVREVHRRAQIAALEITVEPRHERPAAIVGRCQVIRTAQTRCRVAHRTGDRLRHGQKIRIGLRDAGNQLIRPRQEALEQRRCVRPAVAEHQLDGRHVALQRTNDH
jgi:hypothetical protein